MQNKNYFFTRQTLQWNALQRSTLQQFICMLALLLGLHTQGAWAITVPAANFLLPNGSLNTTAIGNQQLSLDLKGWNVSLDPTLGPVFAPAAADGFSAFDKGLNSVVTAIAVSGSDVYVGGNFTDVGSGRTAVAGLNYIAKWNGTAWSALDKGLNFYVLAIAVSSTGDVYVGGAFTNVGTGGTPVAGLNGIAKWNGSAWSALDKGLNNTVYAIAVSGSDVYVGGGFSAVHSTGTSVAGLNRIAKWNGSAWSALDKGLNSGVYAIAVSGSDVYVGGGFIDVGSTGSSVVGLNHIAKWNGSAWSALDKGLEATVYAIAVSGSDVYVGGDFTGVSFTGTSVVGLLFIAKWNGSAWSALDKGLNWPVIAIAVSGSDVYVGGQFTNVGSGTSVAGLNSIAKWNGSAWSALDKGLDATVYDIAVSGSDVYVGGQFTAVGSGGTAVAGLNNIAKWGAITNSPTITTTGTLTAFTACAGTASTEQNFSVSGSDLSADITVTAPTGFEVSKTSGSGFNTSVTLTQSGSSVASTTIYVRMAATATGTPSGNVTLSSTGAINKTVAVSGTVKSYSLAIGSGTNPTTCSGTNGSISFTYNSGTIPNGTYTMSYLKGTTSETKNVTFGSSPLRIAAGASAPLTATLSGLGAGSYSNFKITVNGCEVTATGTTPVVLSGTNCCPGGSTLYVNASVSGGTGDGSTWANAYASLSNALATAHVCNIVKTIKVAAGTYKPTKKPFNAGVEMTTFTNQDFTFHIPDGVTIEGGYDAASGNRLPAFGGAGGGSILSGDLNGDDMVSGSGSTLSITGTSDNVYHVVLSAPSSGGSGVTIDGFSITGGSANRDGFSTITVNGNTITQYYGAGIYVHNGTNRIENNALYGNLASTTGSDPARGAGIYTNGGTNTLRYNTVYNNLLKGAKDAYGGGVHISGGTNNTISHNTLHGNNATAGYEGAGGGIYTSNGTNTLTNNTLYNNIAGGSNAFAGYGGGVYISGGTNTISHNTLHGNKADAGAGGLGGGIYMVDGTNTLTNNTLYNNTAIGSSGGVGGGIGTSAGTNTLINNTLYNNEATVRSGGNPDGGVGGGIYTSAGTNTINNNIFWGNKIRTNATLAGADYRASGTNGNTFKNNLLQLAESNYTGALYSLGTGASGNIFAQDPLFVDAATPAGADGIHRTADDGLSLQSSSPCVNAGTTGTGIPTTDITGAARTGNPDMGAYEAVCTTPTFAVGTKINPTTCGGNDGSIPLTGLTANTSYSVSYQKDGGSATVTTLSSNASGVLTLSNLGAGSYTNITVTLGNCSSVSATASLSNPASATASISGTTSVCQNASNPVVIFTGANGTGPYTFTYRINGGAVQTLTTTGTSSSAFISQSTSVAGVYRYELESVNDAQSCGQNQSGSATVTVQGKPTVGLSIQQVNLGEGSNQTFCDTDTNPVNPLQLSVSSGCAVGNPVWRVQVGNGAWSEWSATAPVSQSSNNQVHRYQAACDANCPNSYTNPISVTINYRASTPQNVSMVADGTTVAAGEEKSICDQTGNAITFNATCATGESLIYSVDGSVYLPTVPTQMVDGQYHNYRVRCQKTDGTVSCVETASGVMRLKISAIAAAPVASLNVKSGCGTASSFSGTANCNGLTTVWYNATTNAALPNLPTTTPNETTSYYARCQGDAGCQSEKSNTVTFTVVPVNDAPIVSVSSDLVCTGVEVTVSTSCPSGASALWNTGVTGSSFKVAFGNVTTQGYSAKCVFENGCQSPISATKTVRWKGFELTIINIGQSKSAIKTNDRAAWASQFVTADAGPSLDNSTESNPTLYYSENANKTGPRYWTIHADACALGTSGSMTFDLLATPETGVVRSFNTHENNAPYFMYANREGYTELYAQNHPAYGFFLDNGSGVNVYDEGLPKGLYKLGVRYWDQKGWGSIFPSTRKPQGSVLAYQEYWFRIQSKDGIGTGAARVAADLDSYGMTKGAFAQVMPNPVSNVLRLKVTDAKAQKVNVSLIDASGRTLLQRNFVPETNQHQEEFNVSEMANGMYFLKVNAGDKQTTLKVVKVQ